MGWERGPTQLTFSRLLPAPPTRLDPSLPAAEPLLQLGDEAAGAERPAGPLMPAQCFELLLFRRHAEESRPVVDHAPKRRHVHQAVTVAGQMRRSAAPGSVRRPLDQPGADRVELDLADGG